MTEDREKTTAELFPEAVASLRWRRKGIPDPAAAVQTQIDEALDALKEDLLPAMNEHALLEAFHEAAREIGDRPGTAYSLERLAYAEMTKTNERLEALEAEIKQLKEDHETTIHRLRILWAMQDAMKPPPMVATR